MGERSRLGCTGRRPAGWTVCSARAPNTAREAHALPTVNSYGETLELRAGSGLATSATHSTFAHNDAAETSNHLRAGEPAATRGVALRSRIPTGFRPKAQGCEARATLGHRQSIIPNREAVAAHLFPPARLTSVTTPLALI